MEIPPLQKDDELIELSDITEEDIETALFNWREQFKNEEFESLLESD